MKIYLGTTSETKLAIIKEGLRALEPYKIVPVEVDSGIPEQPLDEATTIKGAENRSRRAVEGKQFDMGIGLEGGLVMEHGLYHLICVVSLFDQDGNIHLGISGKLPLPREVSERIVRGEQFGIAIREFQKNMNEKYPPDIYELVEELITRKKSFSEALAIALLKYHFGKKIF